MNLQGISFNNYLSLTLHSPSYRLDTPRRGVLLGESPERGVPKYPLGYIDNEGYLRSCYCDVGDHQFKYKEAHRMTAVWWYWWTTGEKLSSRSVVHHTDFDKTNNFIGNLKFSLTIRQHNRIHNKLRKSLKDP